MILNRQQIKDIIISAEKVNDTIKISVKDGNATVIAASDLIMFQGKIENVELDTTINESYVFDSTAINVLKNAPTDEIVVERVDGKTKIRSGKYRATIEEPVYQSVSFEQENPEKLIMVQNFNKVKDVAHAAATDEMRPILKGINFKISDGKLVVGALDGYRVSSKSIAFKDAGANASFGAIENGYSFTIEKDIINKAISICGDSVCIAMTKSQVVFQGNNIAFLCKKMQGEYIDYAKLLDAVGETQKFKISRDALINATNRCNISKKDIKAICLTLENGLVTISNSANENTVEVGEDIEVVGGSDVKIMINPKYILDALANISDDEVEIQYTEGEKPIRIEGIDYRIMILPVSPKQ